MSGEISAIHEHLQGCVTSVCRVWAIERKDGRFFGFTDHDLDLSFDGMVFEAASGLSSSAVQQSSGLAVDNAEALGALSHDALSEADINAGLFDGAVVRAWLVNWENTDARKLQFKGSIGEIRRGGGAFQAELRGLTEALNQPQGRVYQKPCTAVLGDKNCQVDLSDPGMFADRPVEVLEQRKRFRFTNFTGFDEGWFQRGRLRVLTGAGTSLVSWIKSDLIVGSDRIIETWEPIRADLAPGDIVRLEAGCDKRRETCLKKFDNILNFQGFPFIPGEDWLSTVPTQTGLNDGGSLN